MKLIVQIPCLNEEQTLPAVLASIPREIPGVDVVETLVIDDGSTDRTVEIAQQLGVNHIVRLPGHKGLAAAFGAGIDVALANGADIIVNTDGDNQYPQEDIPRLIEPILRHEADMVIGDRQTRQVEHFAWWKKVLQALGSWVVRRASGTRVPDATSGFRAFSRDVCLRFVVMSGYSYTLETIIQAGKKGMRIGSVPIRTKAPTRESRLYRNVWRFIGRQAMTVVRLYVFYEALRTFLYAATPFLIIGLFTFARFIYLHTFVPGASGVGRNLQSLIIGGTSLMVGFLLIVLGVIAELIAVSRLHLEENLYRTKRLELQIKSEAARRSAEERLRAPVEPSLESIRT